MDNTGLRQAYTFENFAIGANGTILLAGSSDRDDNGGLAGAAEFSFRLNNGGDELTLFRPETGLTSFCAGQAGCVGESRCDQGIYEFQTRDTSVRCESNADCDGGRCNRNLEEPICQNFIDCDNGGCTGRIGSTCNDDGNCDGGWCNLDLETPVCEQYGRCVVDLDMLDFVPIMPDAPHNEGVSLSRSASSFTDGILEPDALEGSWCLGIGTYNTERSFCPIGTGTDCQGFVCERNSDCASGICTINPNDRDANGVLDVGVVGDAVTQCALVDEGTPGQVNPDCTRCDDGIVNGDEEGINSFTGLECGGRSCGLCPACNDGVQNGDETDIDCGGRVCGACPTCDDFRQNGDETGFDCGGTGCNVGCSFGEACTEDIQCAGNLCQNGQCQAICLDDGDCAGSESRCEKAAGALEGLCVSCSDGIRNVDELDVDCGGICSQGCADGTSGCSEGSDCASGQCANDGTCISCNDGIINGGEIAAREFNAQGTCDTDPTSGRYCGECGGAVCGACPDKHGCLRENAVDRSAECVVEMPPWNNDHTGVCTVIHRGATVVFEGSFDAQPLRSGINDSGDYVGPLTIEQNQADDERLFGNRFVTTLDNVGEYPYHSASNSNANTLLLGRIYVEEKAADLTCDPCTNLVKDGNEAGLDCGGDCPNACPVPQCVNFGGSMVDDGTSRGYGPVAGVAGTACDEIRTCAYDDPLYEDEDECKTAICADYAGLQTAVGDSRGFGLQSDGTGETCQSISDCAFDGQLFENITSCEDSNCVDYTGTPATNPGVSLRGWGPANDAADTCTEVTDCAYARRDDAGSLTLYAARDACEAVFEPPIETVGVGPVGSDQLCNADLKRVRTRTYAAFDRCDQGQPSALEYCVACGDGTCQNGRDGNPDGAEDRCNCIEDCGGNKTTVLPTNGCVELNGIFDAGETTATGITKACCPWASQDHALALIDADGVITDAGFIENINYGGRTHYAELFRDGGNQCAALAQVMCVKDGRGETDPCAEEAGENICHFGYRDGNVDLASTGCSPKGRNDLPELCTDGLDNDGNGDVDCGDANCAAHAACQEDCTNDVDDDGDGDTDCDDVKCATTAVCTETDNECLDNIDNDDDGDVDCDDSDCGSVTECKPEICDNGIDDNNDGQADCSDQECDSAANCQGPPAAIHEGGCAGLKVENGANVATCTGDREAAVNGVVTIQPAAGYPSPSNEQCFIIDEDQTLRINRLEFWAGANMDVTVDVIGGDRPGGVDTPDETSPIYIAHDAAGGAGTFDVNFAAPGCYPYFLQAFGSSLFKVGYISVQPVD